MTGKGLHSVGGRAPPGSFVTSVSLIRAYCKETERQKLLLRKWGLAQWRLLLVVNALRSLLSEPVFVNLLRAETMHTLPQPLAELMKSASKFSSSYAKTLLAAIKLADLATPDQRVTGRLPKQVGRMERETESLQQNYRAIEASYGGDILNLVIATGYLSKMIGNREIERYLNQNHSEILEKFKAIVSSASLESSENEFNAVYASEPGRTTKRTRRL
jgi:RepB plasmid partitioning protein